MEQVKPFNQSLAGTTPDDCLENVRKGFGISAKYGSAWEAWQHTQQHADSNIPAGVDVPLFYSYTATIGGVTANYGHINVRLANGTVWSDGNIYASVDAYLENHSPKYVGSGESVNDVTVIKQGSGDMTAANLNQVRMILFSIRGYNGQNGRPNALTGEADDIAQGWVGKDLGVTIDSWWQDSGAVNFREVEQPNVYAAAAKPANFVPYAGAQLFVGGSK